VSIRLASLCSIENGHPFDLPPAGAPRAGSQGYRREYSGSERFGPDSPLEGPDLPPIIKQKSRANNLAGYRRVQWLQDERSTALALSIGIWRHLAMPLLPHTGHTGYASVPGPTLAT
jgi:hypothetical protein